MTDKKDKFTQLVEDLDNGDLTWTHIQMAMRQSVRRRKNMPEGCKDLLCGCRENTGLIGKMFQPISTAIAAVELAYRRGRG